jgi:predicted RNA binding protein YcfA (HicA-like mRNA interferase family)
MPSSEYTLKMLTDSGAVMLRQRGTHTVWELPTGRRVTVSVSRRNSKRGYATMRSRVRRILREEGLMV